MSIASEITRLQGAKADLATAIEGKGVTVPSATKLDGYADLVDAISQGGGGGTMQSKSVSYTPSTSAQSQTVTADAGYDGLSSVAVSVAAMPSGTEGTPTATKGTVSNNSIAVTPSVTNSAGYIEGGTKTGTAVTVSASELVAGYQIKTANGTYDVTNLASLIVNVQNSYSASDEGKVVSSGALVAQTSDTVTANDTYDTTLINSLTVNVAGSSRYSADDVAVRNYSGSITLTANKIVSRAFSNTPITAIDAPNVTMLEEYAFAGCTDLTSVNLPIANSDPNNANSIFRDCTSLQSIYLPSLTIVWNYFFTGCSKLKTIVIPKLIQLNRDNNFNGLSLLQTIDIGGKNSTSPQSISASWVKNDAVLNALVLRYNTAVSLSNITAFAGTPFASGGTGGTLYVPADLLSSYQSASNWSTILGYTNNQIKSIESTHTDPTAPVDLTTHYADGTQIPT